MAKAPEFDIPSPRENPNLFGHSVAEQAFLQDFKSGRLHHAYLLTGPKGIGKATFAFRMARYVLSQGAQHVAEEGPSLFGDTPSPAAANDLNLSPQSPLFRRIATGSHTDLLSLSPAYDAKKQTEKSQISVDDARRVTSFLSLTPAEGAWRVVVVDAVDQLNHQAANALLKILEEPPENALLLLVCHAPGSILPTIRSRCRQFALAAPDRAAFDQVLQTVAPGIAITDYPALYGLSYGSPGLAVTLAMHNTVGFYEGWLQALQPGANDEARNKFINTASAIKSPEAWAMLIHGWSVLMHRLSLYPDHDRDHPVLPREETLLAAIADAVPLMARQRWQASARNLLGATDTFNLDRRYTIRLMLDPARLMASFPAAA